MSQAAVELSLLALLFRFGVNSARVICNGDSQSSGCNPQGTLNACSHNNTWTCYCKHFYYGAKCEHFCVNGTFSENNATCSCFAKYSGTSCTIPECAHGTPLAVDHTSSMCVCNTWYHDGGFCEKLEWQGVATVSAAVFISCCIIIPCVCSITLAARRRWKRRREHPPMSEHLPPSYSTIFGKPSDTLPPSYSTVLRIHPELAPTTVTEQGEEIPRVAFSIP